MSQTGRLRLKDLFTERINGVPVNELNGGGGGGSSPAFGVAFYDRGTVTSITGETLASGTDLSFEPPSGGPFGEPLNFVSANANVAAGTPGPQAGNLTNRKTMASFGATSNGDTHVTVHNTGEFSINVASAGAISFTVDWPGNCIDLSVGTVIYKGVYHARIQGSGAGPSIPLYISVGNGTNQLRFFGEVPAGSSLIDINQDQELIFDFEISMGLDFA